MNTPVLDGTGLQVLRTEDVRDNLVEAILGSTEFGADAQTGADKALGQIIDAPAPGVGDVYELIQACYDAWNVDNAEGVHLDNLCRLTGITRMPATYSTATLTLTGTPATTVPAGSRARVLGGAIFALDADATIGGGGTVDAAATATETGPLEASAGSITTIVDAVAGWTGVTNAADAEIGTDIETDTALRRRRRATLARGGSCTDQAARGALEALEDVTAAVVISNRSHSVDSYGYPPHSRTCVVHPSTAAPAGIARAIWDHLSGGLYSNGDQDAVIEMVNADPMTVRWYWAAPVEIWWEVDITKGTAYPTNGDDLVEAAVLSYGNNLSVGDNVLPIGAIDSIFDNVPGISHIVVRVGRTVSPVGTVPVTVAINEVSEHDSTRITVAS